MFYMLTVHMAEKTNSICCCQKNLFIHLFVYPTNIYEAFIKLFLYTKDGAMWQKVVFYGNSYNQYFDFKEIIKNLNYFSVFNF